MALARRIVAELDLSDATLADLTALRSVYDRGGGVGSPAKNLIFAANGPKPELVLRDAVRNEIEFVRNGEYCLVYDRPIPADGLASCSLIEWWRERQGVAGSVSARDVGIDLHGRLRATLGGNLAERRVFDAYATRYKDEQFDAPALIPQASRRPRRGWNPPVSGLSTCSARHEMHGLHSFGPHLVPLSQRRLRLPTSDAPSPRCPDWTVNETPRRVWIDRVKGLQPRVRQSLQVGSVLNPRVAGCLVPLVVLDRKHEARTLANVKPQSASRHIARTPPASRVGRAQTGVVDRNLET
ncbi:hypothetical protein GCM10009718_36790 [Isoptericola halotolerans]